MLIEDNSITIMLSPIAQADKIVDVVTEGAVNYMQGEYNYDDVDVTVISTHVDPLQGTSFSITVSTPLFLAQGSGEYDEEGIQCTEFLELMEQQCIEILHGLNVVEVPD